MKKHREAAGLNLHDTQYTSEGQVQGGGRIPWAVARKKLGGALDVWLALRTHAVNDLSRMPRSGVSRRTGLTVRQVERQLHKLRRVGLIEDVGKDWVPMKRADGSPTEGWAFVREVKGGVVRCDDFPYMLIVPRASEKRVLALGRGGARPNSGPKKKKADRTVEGGVRPRLNTDQIDQKSACSKAVEPSSKAGEPTPKSLGNPIQKRSPVKLRDSSPLEDRGEVRSFGTDAPAGGGADCPSFVPAYPFMWDTPVIPPPAGWKTLGINDRSAAKHVVMLYASFREKRYGRRFWWRGSMEEQKWWPGILKAVAHMREENIVPGRWLAWMDAVIWHAEGKKAKKTPPPINIAFSVTIMEKHRAWYFSQCEDYVGSTLAPLGPVTKSALRLARDSQKPHLRANLSLTPASWAETEAAAKQECLAIKESLFERRRGAEWLW